jgi:hypothetical protein
MLRQKAQEHGWDFKYVNLDSTDPVTIGEDDICIYHAWFDDGCFSQQVTHQSCKAKIILQPFTLKMVGNEALASLHEQWGAADRLLLNTGRYWWDAIDGSEYAQYKSKAVRLDNVCNPDLHPFSKRTWNEPGKRAFLCIGYDNPIKGLDQVALLARTTGIKLLHCGTVAPNFWDHVPHVHSMNGMEFTPSTIEWVCDRFDAFLTMGRFDANPTTLNETACWGLLPCCTEQSGYYGGEPFIELKLDDLAYNMDVIDWIQRAPSIELATRQAQIRQTILDEYTIEARLDLIWDTIAEVVL